MKKEIAPEIRRFKEIREDLNLTQIEFADVLGLKNSTADIERGRTKLSGKIVVELLRQFKINPLWIFGNSSQKELHINNGDVSPKVVTVNSAEKENIVLVNQKAAAGYPNNVHDVGWYQQLPAFDIPLPEYRNASYRGFQVEGDSMLPNLSPGEWVLAKAIMSIGEISINKIYVVVLYDSVLIKKIQKLEDPSKIFLVSINEEYMPLEVNVGDVKELWQVNSKLTFSVDATSENGLLKQLQQSMEELKSEFKTLKK